jgi:hypothetical protein
LWIAGLAALWAASPPALAADLDSNGLVEGIGFEGIGFGFDLDFGDIHEKFRSRVRRCK